MKFDKTVPKYGLILDVLSRVYTDLKDQFYDEESSSGKRIHSVKSKFVAASNIAVFQVSAQTQGFGLRQSFKAFACLGKNIEISIKDIKDEASGIKLQLSDGSFISSNLGFLFEVNFISVIQGKRKKGKTPCGFEVGLGSDAILVGWF